MTLLRNTDRLRYHAPVLVCLLLVWLLVLLPTGFEDAVIYKGADRCGPPRSSPWITPPSSTPG